MDPVVGSSYQRDAKSSEKPGGPLMEEVKMGLFTCSWWNTVAQAHSTDERLFQEVPLLLTFAVGCEGHVPAAQLASLSLCSH